MIKSILALGICTAVVSAQTSQPPATQGTQAMSDTQMAAKVRSAITTDSTTGPASHNVHISAHNGTVTLHGKVTSETNKDAILAKARQVAGDSNVKDEITVSKK
jgi:osmotically-inducible protein OsmY